MRNSNLLPVNAKGLVRLRSVLSFRKFGSTDNAQVDSHLLRAAVYS